MTAVKYANFEGSYLKKGKYRLTSSLSAQVVLASVIVDTTESVAPIENLRTRGGTPKHLVMLTLMYAKQHGESLVVCSIHVDELKRRCQFIVNSKSVGE